MEPSPNSEDEGVTYQVSGDRKEMIDSKHQVLTSNTKLSSPEKFCIWGMLFETPLSPTVLLEWDFFTSSPL